MKRVFITAAAFVFALPVMAQQRKIEGKGEEYHHAMYLNFKHSAEEAEALYNQVVLNRDLNLKIARQHVQEIWTSLEDARIQQAIVHEQQPTPVDKNHEVLLKAHEQALNACKLLRTEVGKSNPDVKVVREQSIRIYQQALKAATEQMDGMKKLGVPNMKAPS